MDCTYVFIVAGRPASADGTSMDLDAISKSVQSHLDSQDPDRIKKCYDFLKRRMKEIIQELNTAAPKKVTGCWSKPIFVCLRDCSVYHGLKNTDWNYLSST